MKAFQKGKPVPVMPARPIIGFLPEFRKDPFSLLYRASLEYGPIVKTKVGPYNLYILTHPDYIQHVLRIKHSNYIKNVFYDELKAIIGKGLVTSEGNFWKQQRRLIQPEFHRSKIASFCTAMINITSVFAEEWKDKVYSGEPVSINEDMKDVTLRIVSATLFSSDVSSVAEKVGDSINVILDYAKARQESMIKLPENFPTPRNLRYKKAYGLLRQVVLDIINERRILGEDFGDLLSMLMAAQDEETGKGMSDEQLFDEVITLFLAGHETTSHALTWTYYLLSQHPEVTTKLYGELDSVLNGRSPTYEDLPNLKYTEMVIKESMRMIPPVWGIGREPLEDDEIDGYFIPAGTIIDIPIYTMHHHPDYWENPEEFIPERFNPENGAPKVKHTYFPFGAGPRKCIGNNFAMMEAQIVLAIIGQKYDLTMVPGQKVEFSAGVTLRPKHDLMMKINLVK